MNTKQPKKTEEVLLEKHTHEGREYAKGAKIWVTEGQREFLRKRKKIAGSSKTESTAK